MEKAFQQLLTEIYHIVSKKAIEADDKRGGVRAARSGACGGSVGRVQALAGACSWPARCMRVAAVPS